MNLLTRAQHALADVVAILVFALGPTVLSLEGGAAGLSYALALVHLVMTLLTDGLPATPGRLIPLPLHGLVEAGVGVGLGLVGWLAFDGTAQAFYLVMAAVILAVFVVTSYIEDSG